MTTYLALVERIACGLNDCRLEQRCSLWRVLAIGTGLAKCFEDTRWLADMRVFGMRKGMVADVRRAASRRRLAAVVANRNSPQKLVWRVRIVLTNALGAAGAPDSPQSGLRLKPQVHCRPVRHHRILPSSSRLTGCARFRLSTPRSDKEGGGQAPYATVVQRPQHLANQCRQSLHVTPPARDQLL